MGEIVVKHFKRISASSDAKELVTEIVVENSDTGRFLTRMEESRLTRPCFQIIDMRGRVAGECRRYAFNDRIHYLDDISFEMFEQGLRDNNGVYTVGTFEAIVGGAHTLQAQASAREEAERRREEIERRRLERTQAKARQLGGDSEEQSAALRLATLTPVENPELLPLGYFRKRTHPRLQYACSVTLQRGNIRTSGMTRDISVCGMRVYIKGLTTFKPGQEIHVSFRGLPVDDGELPRERVTYRIVRIEPRETETALCLSRQNLEKPAGFSQLLEKLVEQHQRKYKLDVEDEFQSILSWVYERSYAQSVTQIPFFVENADNGDLRVQAVAMSEGNSNLARFFCTDADNYNFTPLCLPHRLQHLDSAQPYLLAMYRKQGQQDQCMRIHSAADIEFASTSDFQQFVAWVLQQSDYCIVKVHVGTVPALSVSEKKIDEVAQRLQYKSETQMSELRARLKRLRLVGYMIDVTQDYRKYLGGAPATAADWPVWVGSECRNVAGDTVRERRTLPLEYLQPELIRFGYVERRREDRYLAETRVDVRIGEKSVKGMSKDISTRGMRILLEDSTSTRKGVTVKVGLLSLQQKKSSTNLMDIPYRVVGSRNTEAGTELMLERILGGKNEGLKEFFVELITKNQHKLGVDIGDIWGATASRVYESLLAANIPGIPFFLGRSDEGGAHLQFVGIPESPGPLLDYFRTSDGLDFRCLNESRLVAGLYDAVQILLRQNRNASDTPPPFELELYVYKEFDEVSGETFIQAASELDFVTDARREAFLMRLDEYDDWRCIKLIATFTQSLDEKALDKMIESVRTNSRHRAIKLSDLVHSLVGYGELVDITPEWYALRAAGHQQ
jgi:c-di-GMP-binding flagellar brake protein YcgR